MPSNLIIRVGPAVFNPPYFDELVAGWSTDIRARLPKEVGAHALWYYYILAAKNLDEAKKNLVYEDQLSRKFEVPQARTLLESVATMYQLHPAEMVRFWEAVDQQRIALGFSENAALPHAMRFRFN